MFFLSQNHEDPLPVELGHSPSKVVPLPSKRGSLRDGRLLLNFCGSGFEPLDLPGVSVPYGLRRVLPFSFWY